MHNLYALSFIHLFEKLLIEFNSFDDEEQGGLLIDDEAGYNVFQNLAWVTSVTNNLHAVNVISREWIHLRRIDLMKKDDIREYELLPGHFMENCARFLVEWDPECLIQINHQVFMSPHQIATN